MNLLARTKESGLLLLAGLMLVWGCKEDLGIDLPPDVQRTEVKVIELTLPMTNVYFDSLRTDKEGVFLVGSYSDQVFGTITSKAFTEYSYKSGTFPTENFQWIKKKNFSDSLTDLEFAGARLVLDVDQVLTNDNSFNQYLEFRTLEDSVFAEAIYLSHRSIPDSDIIAEGEIFIANLNNIDFSKSTYVPVAVEFRDEFSQYLYDDYKENGNIRRRGFSVSAISGNGMSSFDLASDTTEIQLYMRGNLYDTSGVATIRKDTLVSMVFFRLSTSNHFTQVTRDRSGSITANVTNAVEVDLSEEYIYFNELAGIYPRIDLAPFVELAESEQGALINRATLSLEVESNAISIPYMQSINYYFSKRGSPVNVNWPAIFQAPGFFRTVLQNDSKYLSPNSQLSSVVHQIDTLSKTPIALGYKGSPTIFWQYIYDNAIYDWDEVEVDKRPTMHQYLADVEKLIIMNSARLSLGRTFLKKDGVKLKIYYTKPRE